MPDRESATLTASSTILAPLLPAFSPPHTATHCNTLQHTQQMPSRGCAPLRIGGMILPSCFSPSHCNTLQHTATHCHTLQHTPQMQSRGCAALRIGSTIFPPCFPPSQYLFLLFLTSRFRHLTPRHLTSTRPHVFFTSRYLRSSHRVCSSRLLLLTPSTPRWRHGREMDART